MGLLEASGSNATFFVLGWVAKTYPNLVREIASRGFDVASHGYGHVLVHQLSPDEFREDLKRSMGAIGEATGQAVKGYRAAGFSITPAVPWAFDILAEEGIEYDASIFPGRHGHGGYPIENRSPFLLETRQGHSLMEFPVAAVDIAGKCLSFGGGGYFRLLPGWMTRRLVQRMNGKDIPATLYLHPREIDPDQPRLMDLPPIRRFKYYVNLSSTERKLRALLQKFHFTSMRDYLNDDELRKNAESRQESI
jgi:polysaccharide deacetylase family protein (PEP-CTERM system associated)